MRTNFADVYDQNALSKDQEMRMNAKSSGRLNRLFGTSSKRLARRNFR